jgi:uncharacterized repeat protein (TIGR02543 family)
VVTLTATANAGYTFSGWSGAASGTTTPTTLTMDANKSVTANFAPTKHTLTVTINPATGGTVATPTPTPGQKPMPATFELSAITISPTEVETGEETKLCITVSNVGEETDSYELTIKINNEMVETRSITLAGGSSREVTFTVSMDIAGTYTVDVNGRSGSFVVKRASTWWDTFTKTVSGWKDNIVDWGCHLIDKIGNWGRSVFENVVERQQISK